MRIFTKKAFEFKNVDGSSVITAPLAFHDVPDGVKKDQMFKWAVADGDVEIIGSKKKQTALENDGDQDPNTNGEQIEKEQE